ncbi:phosphonate metabolism protein/1,5-bisphosphokinase (PRPP-forming) PhnN [Amphritea sp. 2_MG-2023]|uniref:phosphonate metabolism protein/1,5-bisphosphokinase (PRPP-forming) PhnN n=1 Tax=Amphritea TaxID=515417 RepID=UPI001C074BD4|nr:MULTISPECIES: phosphonate metabolism protein/1,5-bisphosphokinase (PRPP-forming) PhnN [Amphritea]MBU2966900.1 phosphonate metabolism protein/1,5-bisphosphokinase (PRPP-forming) PhnN [Amphritea atlantica]MDO6420116.1 phosphonate metabolism protein/1,5-bisphosphokinase (PRPP-forming) PhnN [Amphritea sp. 2_MG-2023]MDX2421376.1 phosphonate metabolism protein/1,5-bisphosphokinase (PRPP-forming) PhnN [Amphritea sp.]
MSGKLLYLVGASGSGKDSLLEGCRQRLQTKHRCFVAHRYITRAPNVGGENHIHLSPEEFDMRASMGMFAMQWYSHDYSYGIGAEIDNWLAKGVNVVINGSREYLQIALHAYPNLIPVLVQVDEESLRQRLIDRGRESEEEIVKRLNRHRQFVDSLPDSILLVDNNENLQQGVNALLTIIESLAPDVVKSARSTH